MAILVVLHLIGNSLMATIVDARGQACPQPVILTRKALQEASEVVTIVDNETSQHNVIRMAEKMGATVQAETKDDGIYLHIGNNAVIQPAEQPQTVNAAASGNIVILIADQFAGRGDPELGQLLMRSFFHTLTEVMPLPDTIIFMNSGVRLVTAVGSAILEDLHTLANQGVQLLACGTCLGHYNLKDKVAVGEISNMYTIAETLLNAGKVISL